MAGLASVQAQGAVSVTLTSPAANSPYIPWSNATLTANASSPGNTITQVDFYAATGGFNTLIGTSYAAPYNFIWNVGGSAKSYLISAVATDNLGVQTASPATTINVIAPPAVTLSSPVNNTVAIAPASFTLSADASSLGSLAKVEFYYGGILLGTAFSAPYTYTWNNIPSGTYTLMAKATDTLGQSTYSSALNVTAATPPTVTLSSPAANSSIVAPGSFTLTANAQGTSSGLKSVSFYNGTTLLNTVTAAPYSYTWNNIAAGNYSLSAVATDNNNLSTPSSAVAVTVTGSKLVQTYYIHTDHLDTPREVTDSNGAVVWRWDNSDPFGSNIPNENPNGAGQFSFNLRFPGQYFDRETNTHYNINRDYDPSIGRYVESDPIGLAGGINTYTYVGGNPLSYVDPFGLDRTIWVPGPGRTIFDGPRNGNWGGGKWSGGISGGGTGNAPPRDSGDACYMRHDQCYDSGASKNSCNANLVNELKSLPADPRMWPMPPSPGTERDTNLFREGAILIFGQ